MLPPVELPVISTHDLPIVDNEKALPVVPALEPKPAWLTIAPLPRLTQGPLTLPPTLTPIAVPVVSLPTPVIDMVREEKEATATPSVVLPVVPFVPVRPLKQDRN